MIKVKRAYEKPEKSDGRRILVDRTWPHGISKEELHFDEWIKGAAPSSKIQQLLSEDSSKWESFEAKYLRELKGKEELLQKLRQEANEKTITLVYAARSESHNNAVVLKKAIERC
jgi:uncharacterized protein YeaO (DUF488 family)